MSEDQHPELGRILAIDADPARRLNLHRVLSAQIRADLVVVASVEEALDAIGERAPDLILISTFQPPADEKRIVEYLKGRSETAHTQVIALPEHIERGVPSQHRRVAITGSVVLRFPAKRDAANPPGCDGKTLGQLIGTYLDQAHARRASAQNPQCTFVHYPQSADAGGPASETSLAVPASLVTWPEASATGRFGYVLPRDRRRAPRRRAADLAGEWAVRLLAASEARLVNLSRLGVLLETTSKLPPGIIIELQLLGIEKSLSVAARLVRREVADASSPVIRYHIAAAFSQEVDIFTAPAPPCLAAPAHPPKVLADLLGRVLADANWVSNGTSLCSAFEEELGRLGRLRQVRIGPGPALAPDGCQSAAFRIPGSSNARLRLHIVFEPGHEPTPNELRLLETAATLASVVLELAPSARLHSPTT